MAERRRRAPRTAGQRLLTWIRGRNLAAVLLAVDGLAVSLVGLFATVNSFGAVLGEFPLLLIGGLALTLFGVMIIFRRSLNAAKTGLIGLTAGYFATALSEFEVATDPCDIGATLERCATDVVKGAPYIVYQGPLFLAILAFLVIVLEPLVDKSRSSPP